MCYTFNLHFLFSYKISLETHTMIVDLCIFFSFAVGKFRHNTGLVYMHVNVVSEYILQQEQMRTIPSLSFSESHSNVSQCQIFI